MEILDVDMQMVRDALATAPEYVKGHFENLVAEHDKASTQRDELRESHMTLETKLEEAEHERDEAKGSLETADEEHAEEIEQMESVLSDLKYWFLDVMVHGRPMTDPRKMLRKVEAVL